MYNSKKIFVIPGDRSIFLSLKAVYEEKSS